MEWWADDDGRVLGLEGRGGLPYQGGLYMSEDGMQGRAACIAQMRNVCEWHVKGDITGAVRGLDSDRPSREMAQASCDRRLVPELESRLPRAL